MSLLADSCNLTPFAVPPTSTAPPSATAPAPKAPAPSSAGRPRALDEIKCREICALISAGARLESAADYVNCSAITIRREAKRNPEFDEQLRRASLAAELSPLNAMRQASNRHWRAAAWLLERVNPQRFARQKPNVLKPEQLKYFVEVVTGILKESITDAPTVERVRQRLADFIDRFARESWALHADPDGPAREKLKNRHSVLAEIACSALSDSSVASAENRLGDPSAADARAT